MIALLQMLQNIFSLSIVLVIFSVVGAGVFLPLRLSGRWRYSILLAPLLGMIAFASLGLFRIAVLLKPLAPRRDAAALLVIALVSSAVFRKQRRLPWRRIAAYLIIPGLFLIAFSYTFSRGGFHMLNGSQDELQYAMNAQHMLEHQHIGDPMDSLIPRPDHWLADSMARDLCYNKGYRRGAEITLANVTRWLGISPQQAFTVLCGASIFALLLAASVVSRAALGLSHNYALFAQACVAFSSYIALLFVSGSLANLCSIGIFLAANGLGTLAFSRKSRGPPILTGLLGAGTLIFYSEVVLPGLLIPLGIATACMVLRERGARILAARNFLVFVLIAGLVSHQAIQSAILSSLFHIKQVTSPASPIWYFNVDMSLLLGTVEGLYSIHQNDASNHNLYVVALTHPLWILSMFIAMAIVACYGYFKCHQRRGFGLLAVVLVLFPMTLLFAWLLDYLRFVRSTGYMWVYLILGLVCALSFSRRTLRVFVAVVLFGILALNVRTTLFMYDHMHRYDLATDPLYRRLNPRDPIWETLRKQLSSPARNPVLITGFKTTPEPHWIVSGIEPVPNFLGTDIQSFWGLMRPVETGIFGVSGDGYGFRNSTERTNISKLRYPDWNVILPDFLQRSEYAIVPSAGDFPVDWEAWRDVLPARRVHFQKIGDVLYKNEKALGIPGEGLGDLKKDSIGLYRSLNGRARLVARDKCSSCCMLQILYEGTPADLKVTPARSVVYEIKEGGRYLLRAVIQSDREAQFNIEGPPAGLKIRKIDWEQLSACPP
jgi:hypothetical protein